MDIVASKSHSKKIFIILALLFLPGCSGLEKSEKEKIRQRNAKGEYVYRRQDDRFAPLLPPKHREREAYPWEKGEKDIREIEASR